MAKVRSTWTPDTEPSGTHLTYLALSLFLICYALFSEFIRNKLHLSEPPLGTLFGIVVDLLGSSGWRYKDNITQEVARVVVGVQVFAVGLDLPSGYVKKHWKGLALLLGPNMMFGWCSSAVIMKFVLGLKWSTAFIIAATLTPTDPVLSASVLGEAKFSTRVPKRIRHILAAESGSNDGTAYPFLYAAILAVTHNSKGEWAKSFFLDIIFWQCGLGVLVGVLIGLSSNKLLRFSETRDYIQPASLLVFYFLLAILSIGIASSLGLDGFLVSFSAGTAFCWDGWFHDKTQQMKLPSIIDLLLNSTMFVYFGTIIPWESFTGNLNAWKLLACTILLLLFRRIPLILSLKRILPESKTWSESLFIGHFGPMGVGALFLAMEARGRLENGSSTPEPHPPRNGPHSEAIDAIWPVVSFVVLGSIMVHGFSAAIMSVYSHFIRHPNKRSSTMGGETERLGGMEEENDTLTEGNDNSDDDSDVEDTTQQQGNIRIE